MLYIHKTKPSDVVVREIAKAKSQINVASIDKQNAKDAYRAAFDAMDKTQIRKALLEEQHYICGYCMRRIMDNDKMTIEHVVPVTKDVEKVFSYDNYMAVCDGGRKSDKKRILCCDASKGNASLYVDTYSKEMMNKIKYERNGRIYVDEQNQEDKKINYDINYILRLNGEIDKSGNTLCDSASELVKNRKDEYRKYILLMERLTNKGKMTSARIQNEIDKLLDKTEYDEYVGVMLFFLKRKMRTLKKA